MTTGQAVLVATLSLGILSAQTGNESGVSYVPPPGGDLQQYLGLSQAQMTALEQVQQTRRDAEAAIYNQISEKERTLWGLLNQGSNDAAQVGALMIEINTLRRKLPLNGEPYRAAALAVLTDQQKAKVPALAEALRLVPPASQAIWYNLIDNPNDNRGIGLPRPLPGMSGAEPAATLEGGR